MRQIRLALVVGLVIQCAVSLGAGQRACWRPYGPMSAAKADAVVRKLDETFRNSAQTAKGRVEDIRRVLVANEGELLILLASPGTALQLEAIRESGGRRLDRVSPILEKIALRQKGANSIEAIQALGEIEGAKSTKALISVMRKGDAEKAEIAALNLAEQGYPVGLSRLVAAIGRRRASFEQKRFGEALINIGYGRRKSEFDLLLAKAGEAIRTDFPALARKNWKPVRPALRALLTNAKVYHGVRKWAAVALGEVKDKASVKPLIAALSDPVADVRAEAARALGKVGEPVALKHLLALEPSTRNPTSPQEKNLKRAVQEAIANLSER